MDSQKQLTPKQKRLLQIIREFYRTYGHYPSLRELKNLYNSPSTSPIVHLLKKLAEKGYIQKIPGTERGISLVDITSQTYKIPLVGSVACGNPLLAMENIEGYIDVDKSLLASNSSEYFFLKAVGDSMDNSDINGKNIEDGDLILIKKQSTVNLNEKVVALINDEATVKVFKRDKETVILTPESTNPNNKPIILNNDFSIQGVVKAVFKKEAINA